MRPVSIVSTSGEVRNASALRHPARSAAGLTRTSTDTGATDILLDYGKDVGGPPYFVVTSETGSPVTWGRHVTDEEYGAPAS